MIKDDGRVEERLEGIDPLPWNEPGPCNSQPDVRDLGEDGERWDDVVPNLGS